jgi:hypothetical protein
MAVTNAIIGVGNHIASAVSGGEAGGSDKLKDTLDMLKGMLLPHYKEEQDRKAERSKKLLAKEVAGGPIQVKIVGKSKDKKHGRK